jgi:hypothetical protein
MFGISTVLLHRCGTIWLINCVVVTLKSKLHSKDEHYFNQKVRLTVYGYILYISINSLSHFILFFIYFFYMG